MSVQTMQITAREFKQCFPKMGLDNSCIDSLLSAIKPRKLEKGEQLIAQNQFSDTVYLVMSGRLHLEMDSEDIKINLSDCKPGCWTGELGFIEPGVASANVTAAEETIVLPISQSDLTTLLETSPETISVLLHTFSLNLAERLRETRSHVVNKVSEDEYTLEEKPESPDKKWFNMLANKIMSH